MSDIGNKDVFSENLARRVADSDKTRREICEELGIPYSTFCEWLSGKKYPRIDKIELLANYFHIQKSDLIEDQSNRIPDAYLSLARDAAKDGLDPDDLRLAIETVRNMRKRGNN